MFAVSWEEFSLIMLIFVVSSMTQGIMGFGFGIVAMTLLPLAMGFKDAVTLLSILNAVMMVLSLFWQQRVFNWRDARYLMIGGLIGLPVGGFMIHVLPENLLLGILGGTMLFVSIEHFVTRDRSAKKPIGAWEVPIGMYSGITAAGFNMGGPPIVAYAYSRNWNLDQAKAVIASVFAVTSLGRLPLIGFTAMDLPKILWLSAMLVIPTASILYFAIGLGRRIPHEFLRPIIFSYLGLVGTYYLFLH